MWELIFVVGILTSDGSYDLYDYETVYQFSDKQSCEYVAYMSNGMYHQKQGNSYRYAHVCYSIEEE